MSDNLDVQENTDDQEMNEASGKKGLVIALVIFIVLFAVSAGLLIYQMAGEGKGLLTWQPEEAANVEMVGQLRSQLEESEAENERLQDQIFSLESELDRFRQGEQDWMSGVVYEVQIGAFEFYDMRRYEDNILQMQMDKDNDYSRLTVGRFRDIADARYFRDDLKRMGVNGAVIIKRENAVRKGFAE
jgi:hypothetical protein